jgi:hypothetical protein
MSDYPGCIPPPPDDRAPAFQVPGGDAYHCNVEGSSITLQGIVAKVRFLKVRNCISATFV